MRDVIKKFKSEAAVNNFFQPFLVSNAPHTVGNRQVTLERQNWRDDNDQADNIGNLLQGRLRHKLQNLFTKYPRGYVTITVNSRGLVKEVWAHPHPRQKKLIAHHQAGVAGRAFRKSTSLFKTGAKATGKAASWVAEAGATVALSPLAAMDGVGKMYDAAIEKFDRGGGAVNFS